VVVVVGVVVGGVVGVVVGGVVGVVVGGVVGVVIVVVVGVVAGASPMMITTFEPFLWIVRGCGRCLTTFPTSLGFLTVSGNSTTLKPAACSVDAAPVCE
jgi:hypothetical protein